jgi:hypothetical protein
MPGLLVQAFGVGLLLAGCMGCGGPNGGGTRTIVIGEIQPRQIHYVTVSEQVGEEPGGWREACIRLNIQRSTGESFLCEFGIGVPIQNKDGPISLALAQRLTAAIIHTAATTVFQSATPTSPLGLLCQQIRTGLLPTMRAAIGGSRVNQTCHKKTRPVQLGDFFP